MDKETLSNYGWVVICALVLVVMIALATPFGNFIANAVKNTTQALFGSTKNRLDTVLEDTGVTVDAPDDIVILDANGGGSGGSSTTKTAQEYADASALVTGTIAKGELVTIDGKEYRILSVNGTEVTVLAMTDYIASTRYNPSVVTTSFNGTYGAKYADSNLDAQMTNFYNSLSYKDAIVAQNIKQSMYKYQSNSAITADATIQYYNNFSATPADSAKRGLKRTGEVNVGSRYVYALDVDDVIAYFGGGFNCQQLNTLFFKTTSATNKYVWLRSAFADDFNYVFSVIGEYGNLDNYYVGYSRAVRPAFVIDLAKLS